MNLKTLCSEKKFIEKGYKLSDSAYVMTQLQTEEYASDCQVSEMQGAGNGYEWAAGEVLMVSELFRILTAVVDSGVHIWDQSA